MKKLPLIAIFLFLMSCQYHQRAADHAIVQRQPKTNAYHLENAKQWLEKNKSDSLQLQIALAVNRTDRDHFALMDSVIMPDDMSGDIVFYLPFPLSVPYLKDVSKIIFFSYPAQVFAAYEKGTLAYTGPTNMGREKDPTPTGLFYTNWKAEETTSTFNDEWDLHWNFNILNKEGIGFHQYSLPGYPASHSCLRLQEKDARYLYNWADQWISAGKDSILAKGTPVIVFGAYDFSMHKPWLALLIHPHLFDISEDAVRKETAPYLSGILAEQKRRDSVLGRR